MATLPIIDLDAYLNGDPTARAREAKNTADALIQYGALIVKDGRVSESDNGNFLDLLEDYFAQPNQELLKDTRPEFGYQVGATLENTEKPRCTLDTDCHRLIESLDPSERPLDLTGEHKDPKSRFFWRMDQSDSKPQLPKSVTDDDAAPESKFAALKAPNVIPVAFADVWQPKMDKWGTQMLRAVTDVNEMLAVGLGLDSQRLKDLATNGSHLLAPTATNLERYGQKDHIFAGFHSDLNYLTIHGSSRFSGLHIWARNSGKRIAVKMPPGHLLVQAGKQLEHLTGGLILAGFHEVVCTDATLASMARRRASNPERPLCRISSTFFYHLSPHELIAPLPELEARRQEVLNADLTGNAASKEEYPEMYVGELVQRELQHIALMA